MKRPQKGITILLLIFSLMYGYTSYSQDNPLYQLGESMVEIARSNNPDKVLDHIDPDLDLDKKAEILESFLSVKDKVFNSLNKDKIKLFNALKQSNSTLFIITDGKKFYIIKTQTNDKNQITEHFAIIKDDAAQSLTTGQKIYKLRCYSCHGKEGKGGIGPNLTDSFWKFVSSAQDLQDIIAKGKKGTMMIAYKDYLSPEELKAVTLYVKALQGKKVKNPKKKEGEQKNIQFEISNE